MLKQLGYKSEVAVDGLQAVAAYAQKKFDFVLMDINMPEMDDFITT